GLSLGRKVDAVALNNQTFHLFGPLKQHLGGKHFADDDDIQHEVLLWIQRRDDGNSTEIKLPTKLNNSDLEDQPNDSEMPGRICRTTSLERTLTENHPLTEKERYQNLDMNRYEDVS
ncbi:hypothetical protein AVEN_86592-1, partial [Araneus ventricosus]